MDDTQVPGGAHPGGGALVHVTVVLCAAPREVHEWALELPCGATVGDALRVSGAEAVWARMSPSEPHLGLWGRTVHLGVRLRDLDRVEVYRPLRVDPKVARRERFARQGTRSAGLFARQRPGGKAGY